MKWSLVQAFTKTLPKDRLNILKFESQQFTEDNAYIPQVSTVTACFFQRNKETCFGTEQEVLFEKKTGLETRSGR